MKPSIIVKYDWDRAIDGRILHRWEIEFNNQYLGRFKSKRLAISALTVRKVPHDEAIKYVNGEKK